VNKVETAQVLGYLSAAYPSAKVTKETAIVFHDLLKELSATEVMSAAQGLVRECDWFPSPAQLLRAVARSNGVLSPIPAVAWQEVLAEVRRVGQAESPRFSHATTSAVVKAIGWREICMSDNANVLRSNFLKLYHDMSVALDRESLSKVVAGALDALGSQKAISEASEA
jgi:hypothetical protein